ncbi:hypothetical protein C8F04DRAFT_1168343 [Mycena alexandri]|uniref:Uncharacterized protein n=1 Tax=Mycena alexandri TaxID=1745969 RepID=A0AAD6RVE9_9AGAR|nr:hypothetical protein C8F04DRAFT_1168343 [Mycena alexandri]
MASKLSLALLILLCTYWILQLQSSPAICPTLPGSIPMITTLSRMSHPMHISSFVKGGSPLHQCCSSGFQVNIEQAFGTQVTQW